MLNSTRQAGETVSKYNGSFGNAIPLYNEKIINNDFIV